MALKLEQFLQDKMAVVENVWPSPPSPAPSKDDEGIKLFSSSVFTLREIAQERPQVHTPVKRKKEEDSSSSDEEETEKFRAVCSQLDPTTQGTFHFPTCRLNLQVNDPQPGVLRSVGMAPTDSSAHHRKAE
jgi:hypothetical protein